MPWKTLQFRKEIQSVSSEAGLSQATQLLPASLCFFVSVDIYSWGLATVTGKAGVHGGPPACAVADGSNWEMASAFRGVSAEAFAGSAWVGEALSDNLTLLGPRHTQKSER